ncbi:MAG: oligoendopeptidase F [Bacteroides sp.]|nr:oligoendopeptidase F [Eubacterium sp.]MCM1417415.1 oligoendopeptidase F [Roseburia sp.]MCM1461594.1 oligoendopeptidase F [Bacteroides sp.]
MAEKKIPQRSEIEDKYKWRLEDLFPSDGAFETALAEAGEYPEKIAAYRGKISADAKALLAYLRLDDEITEKVRDLLHYANRKSDEDTRVSLYSGYCERTEALLTAIGSAAAFAVPEILTISDETLKKFLAEEEGLKLYELSLRRILNRRAHILSPEEERIAAMTGEMRNTPSAVFSMLDNADMKFPDAIDSDGNARQLTHGSYIPLMQSEDRVLRRSAFENLYKTYRGFENTYSAILSGHLKTLSFNANIRRYENTLAAALDSTEVPQSVYHSLIDAVHRNMDRMYRYVALRKKILGVDELHYYDLYAPMVKKAEREISYEEAKETVLEAIRPLGEDYRAIMQNGFESGWIDVYENEGKCSGAYSAGASVHPYVLLNHTDDLQSEFTIAHEMGHALHSYLSNKNQPTVYAEYEIFVAEVASTFNESLLMQHLLKTTTDKRRRAYLINYFLEQFRTTLYRQTMFAEFELKINEAQARGEAITSDFLCDLYGELNLLYFGDGIVADEEIRYEWARIPHFYYNYYVYQYATGFAAAIALSRRVLNGGAAEAEAYLGFLKGGNSKTPVELLKGAGVDMTDPRVVDDALKLFGELLDEMEKLAEELD